MKTAFHLNIVFAWIWILLGFASGLYLGMHFHKEGWMGGYGSLKRRLYRLGHISFFGLGAANLFFYLTAQKTGLQGNIANIASVAFVIGGIAMPLCCLVMAHKPQTRMLFAVPVVSLLVGGLCTIWELISL